MKEQKKTPFYPVFILEGESESVIRIDRKVSSPSTPSPLHPLEVRSMLENANSMTRIILFTWASAHTNFTLFPVSLTRALVALSGDKREFSNSRYQKCAPPSVDSIGLLLAFYDAHLLFFVLTLRSFCSLFFSVKKKEERFIILASCFVFVTSSSPFSISLFSCRCGAKSAYLV